MMQKILKLLWLAAGLTTLAGCQLLPVQPATPSGAAEPLKATASVIHRPPAEREALIQSALATYSTIPAEPILRIDTQAHIRSIHALALAPRAGLLATASVDRTIRLWEQSSGRLIDTLRVPTGSHGLGTTHALAFSPDGKILAAGGLSFFAHRPATLKQATFTLYFFDVAQRSLLRTLDDVPGRIHHLAYAPNGKQLAVAYGAESIPELGAQRSAGVSGLRIYDAESLALLREVTTDSPCEWAEFDARQRLFAACRNTLLAFDNQQLARIHEAPHDAQFYRAALAPDGRSLALSYDDRARIEVLSTDDLTQQYSVELPADADHYGDLQPTWSPGGLFLYAAGRRVDATTKENHLFKWPHAGRGKAQRFEVGQLDLLALQTHRDGRLFYATSEGSVGTLDANDQHTLLIEKSTVASDNRPGALWVSADGLNVAYSDDNAGQQRYVFSHAKRTLTPWNEFKEHDALQAPITAGAPQVTRWQLSRQIQCADQTLDLGETVAQNLALLKNGQGFALGTDSGVIFYDAQCRRVWENRTQGRTLAINIAQDAGLVLAQDEAGVIRWLRVADGVKVLSIFTSRNGRSWAAWTPEGFYDASPEGESLVGWHLNRNRQQSADFYHAGRFRELFHNADEISAALRPATSPQEGLSADQHAARLAEIRRRMQTQLPAQVSILAVRELLSAGGPRAQIDYKLRNPSGEPVQRVRALINGRPVGVVQEFATQRPGDARKIEDSVQRIEVPLPPGEAEIGLIAESAGAVGEPAKTRLNERLNPTSTHTATPDNPQLKPKLYALVIGVGAYRHEKIPALDFPAKDARDFAAELKRQRGKLYREVDVRLLEDAAATREAVIDGLDWLRKQVTANDLAVLFMAGHGVNDNANRYYFVPVNTDPARLRSTAIANSDISETLQALPSKVLAFLDTCHAGNVLGAARQRNLSVGMNGDINRLVNELTSAENGVVVFASSTGRETSQESAEWNNGAFTKALVEGLGGRADFNHDGAISLNELNLWVAERVKKLTEGEQHANMIRPDSIRDFPFVLMK